MLTPMQIAGLDEAEIAAADSLVRARAMERIDAFTRMTWEQRFETMWHGLLDFGIKLLVVLAIFFVGRWIIQRIIKMMERIFERRKVDTSIRTFVKSLVKIILYLILFYIIIAYLGVNTSLFVALFAAAGLAIGMALSGVFQNFAGGIMILMLKPFRVGDWVSVQDQAGTVMDIRLFNTVLRTADNQTILLPNGSISSSIITNTNQAKTRRLEWVISMAYGTDFPAVRQLLLGLVKADSRVMSTPEPTVDLGNIGKSTIDITVRCWVKSSDYWGVYYDLNSAIYKTLPEQGFHFPYSELNVNLRTLPENQQNP